MNFVLNEIEELRVEWDKHCHAAINAPTQALREHHIRVGELLEKLIREMERKNFNGEENDDN